MFFFKKKFHILHYIMTIPLLFFINTLLKVESAAADFISSLSTHSFTPSSLSPATSKFTESFFSTSIYNLRVIKSNNFVCGRRFTVYLQAFYRLQHSLLKPLWFCCCCFSDTKPSFLVFTPDSGTLLQPPWQIVCSCLLFKS